jgi:hypothetical protein
MSHQILTASTGDHPELGLACEWNGDALWLTDVAFDPHDYRETHYLHDFDPQSDILYRRRPGAIEQELRAELDIHVPTALSKTGVGNWTASESDGWLSIQRVKRRTQLVSPIASLAALLRALPTGSSLLHCHNGGMLHLFGGEAITMQSTGVGLKDFASMDLAQQSRVLSGLSEEDVLLLTGPDVDDNSASTLSRKRRLVSRFNRACFVRTAHANSELTAQIQGKEHLLALAIGAAHAVKHDRQGLSVVR